LKLDYYNDEKIRLQEILILAKKLNWISPQNITSYPLMPLSEVEKCMLAMINDSHLERLRQWVNPEIHSFESIKEYQK